MDGVDFRILAALHQDGLMSQAALGRVVGLTAPAVANRLAKMTRQGVLQGFRADIHPALFGREGTMHVFAGPHDASDVDQALASKNVVWVAWKLDGSMTVMSYGEADLDALGTPQASMPGDRQHPRIPSPLARRVLAAVVREPRAGRDILAARTGLSPKTCAKHRDAALAQGLAIRPILGTLSGEGVVVFHVAIFGDAARAAIGAALQQAVLVNEGPGMQYWFCMAPDYATAIARQEAVRALGADVQVTMNRRLLQNDARLVAWLETG